MTDEMMIRCIYGCGAISVLGIATAISMLL